MVAGTTGGNPPIGTGSARLRLPRVTVPTNSLTPWLRTRFEVTDGTVRMEWPRTILGVVPLGRRRFEADVPDVRDARVRMVVHADRLAAGVAMAVGAGALALAGAWVAILPALVGAWLLILSYVAAIEVRTTSGGRHRAGICLFYRLDARLFVAAVMAATGQPREGAGP